MTITAAELLAKMDGVRKNTMEPGDVFIMVAVVPPEDEQSVTAKSMVVALHVDPDLDDKRKMRRAISILEEDVRTMGRQQGRQPVTER